MFIWVWGSRGYERTRAISISKIRNSKATKKNWNENGKREGDITLNPHSNWDHFAFEGISFLFTIFVAVPKMDKSRAIVNSPVCIFIISVGSMCTLDFLNLVRLLISIEGSRGVIRLHLRSVNTMRRIQILLYVWERRLFF